jgi:hypothetical protein
MLRHGERVSPPVIVPIARQVLVSIESEMN